MSDRDEVFSPEGNRPGPGKKSGSSGWRILLIVLAIGGSLSLLCCCGIGITFYSMAPRISDDPAVAQQMLDGLIQIEVPTTFTPRQSVSMNVLSYVKLRGIILEGSDDRGTIFVVGLQGSMARDGQLQREIEKAIKAETDKANMEIVSTETKEFEIGGQTVEFTFVKGIAEGDVHVTIGKDLKDRLEQQQPGGSPPVEDVAVPETADAAPQETEKKTIHTVKGLIPTADGPILFLQIVDDEHFDEAETIKMIESIRLP